MGNTSSSKFKGEGKVLGTGEVVKAPQRRSLLPSLGQKTSAAPTTGAVAAKPKPKNASKALTEEEKEERRKAAAAAAEARERAWNERIARQRARREREETNQKGESRAWNEGSLLPQNLPPPDPELLRKQKEAAAALEKSGFNPFQATMSSASAARSVIGSADARSPNHLDSNVSVETMENARRELVAAMQTSDINRLSKALEEAKRYDVPEVEEAQELVEALKEASEISQNPDEVGEEAWEEVLSSIRIFMQAKDTPDRKAATCSILQTLLRNLLDHPEDPKYRKIRLENKAIREKIVESSEGTGIGVLESVGFQRTVDDEGQACLTVPDPSILSAEVVAYARKSCEIALQKLQTMKF